jgi:hypothetical protein
MFDSHEDEGSNVRADRYLIARALGRCPICRGETSVVALLLPPGHETLSMDDDDTVPPSASGGTWERAPHHAFLFYLELIPAAVHRRMQALAPAFRWAHSPATQGSYWANHCDRCGGLQEDHDLFCEPEAAFLPVSPDAAAAIDLVPIAEPIRAGAAGYAVTAELLGTSAPL